jgi:hypothetical protein
MLSLMNGSNSRLRQRRLPVAQSWRQSAPKRVPAGEAWRHGRAVKTTLRIAALCALLAIGVGGASAQTNLEYWTHDLKIALMGRTSAAPRTNGIIVRANADTVKISSREIIQALANKPVLAISKGFTNFTVVVTNLANKTNSFATNNVVKAVPVFTPATIASYSPKAKLLLLEPLGANSLSPLVVIRDGDPSVDYNIADYLQFGRVSFDGRANDVVTAGRFELAHDLVSVTDYGVYRLVFDAAGLKVWPPSGTYFDVQGFATGHRSSLVEKGQVIDNSIIKSAVAKVAGTGQLANTNGFAVLNGVIMINGGKHQTQ